MKMYCLCSVLNDVKYEGIKGNQIYDVEEIKLMQFEGVDGLCAGYKINGAWYPCYLFEKRQTAAFENAKLRLRFKEYFAKVEECKKAGRPLPHLFLLLFTLFTCGCSAARYQSVTETKTDTTIETKDIKIEVPEVRETLNGGWVAPDSIKKTLDSLFKKDTSTYWEGEIKNSKTGAKGKGKFNPANNTLDVDLTPPPVNYGDTTKIIKNSVKTTGTTTTEKGFFEKLYDYAAVIIVAAGALIMLIWWIKR